MQTHSLGRKIKVGIARNGEDIEPLAQEANLNSAYIENRVFTRAKKILPGDHISVECTYNTFKREQFTLGGDQADEEICQATLMYYPKQEQLVSCYSQSNIANLLKAIGIETLGWVDEFFYVGFLVFEKRCQKKTKQEIRQIFKRNVWLQKGQSFKEQSKVYLEEY